MPNSHSNQPRRTLLLTGASRGIGHATVKRFSAAGWRVITCSRHPFPENCPWEMGPEDHIQVDLADPDRTLSAIADIKQRLENGELHALVNNAAISPKANGGSRLSSIDTTVDVWDQVFRVNFFAPITLARGLLEELKAAKGSVVNVTSIAGSRVHPFASAAYATSKAGLAALTREMANDLGRHGVRVNGVRPGFTRTATTEGSFKMPAMLDAFLAEQPIARHGAVDDIAQAVRYLAGPESSWVTGQLLTVDGGNTLRSFVDYDKLLTLPDQAAAAEENKT